MSIGRTLKYLQEPCPVCNEPFKAGEQIDVVREAVVVNFYSSGPLGFRLKAKPPVFIRHSACATMGGEDG